MGRPFIVSSPKQLEVVASPGREEIIDTVAMIGPCSVSELARALRRSRNALYYHLNALRDCGLLLETHRVGGGARSTACYDVPGRPFAVSFDLSTPQRRRAVISLARSRLKGTGRAFERACRDKRIRTHGPRRNLWATRVKGWLSEKEVEVANALFARLLRLIAAKGRSAAKGRRGYEISYVLCPIVPK
jgi:DNA-binding transcriptional ArsR family regulator